MLSKRRIAKLKPFLDEKVAEYNCEDFVPDDPISIPHRFEKLQDKEIMAFFAAMLAWGQRKTIINNCNKLIDYFDGEPYQFMLHHTESDLKRLVGFVHRTYNDTDLLYFVSFFHRFYSENNSLEYAFSQHIKEEDTNARAALIGFHNYFFDNENAPQRTRKHVATPARNSACKRMNMFLRWMVRDDDCGVDMGLWKTLKPSMLFCPLDVHVERVARNLGLLTVKQSNWKAVEELTANLRLLDKDDPVKYDLALFGLGVVEKHYI